MKSCPVCGAPAGDNDVFCEADGAKLGAVVSEAPPPTAAHANTVPALPVEHATCPSCAVPDPDDGDGYCKSCGHLLAAGRPSMPPPIGAKIASTMGEVTVLRSRGEGEVVVCDPAGVERLLVFGARETLLEESAALAGKSASFPPVLAEGVGAPGVPEGRYFLLLGADVTHAQPVHAIAPTLTFTAGVALVRLLLDAAEEMESRGFAWEPSPADLYFTPEGTLVSVRARGARRLLQEERLNAKRALEALVCLLPVPGGFGTPELVRLFLPAFNSSTPRSATVGAAREVVARALAVSQERNTTAVAELCDPGLRRNHNEDATGLAQGETGGEPWTVLVVCDGVSSSTHAEQASGIASKVATATLAHFARSGDIMHEGISSAVLAAIRSAHLAVCTSDIDYGDGAPPGTTIVAAVVFRKRLTVGWVGDSRAYWVSAHGAELCTTDHSWVNDTLARGEMTEAEAMASPLAHALTRCLGPLETGDGPVRDVEPDVRSKALPGPGHVVLCTDGLWNYFPTAGAIAGLVREAGLGADPSTIARFLVCQALVQGGGDNVSVAVYEAK